MNSCFVGFNMRGMVNSSNAVLSNFGNHKRLGIHTEMSSNGVLPLIENGMITGEEKEIKTDNPLVHFKEAGYTNETAIIRKNPKVTAIYRAIEIDLTGQICADTIGSRPYSGVGGQMDFIHDAFLSPAGKPIFAIPSVTAKVISKIIPYLKQGDGVTTTRAHVHYVAKEYESSTYSGKTLRKGQRP